MIHAVALPDGIDMGLGAAAEEPAVVLAGLHHHRKIGQLGGTVVDVQAVEVVLDDALHRLPGGVAVALVDLYQKVKQIDKNMSGAAAGVDALDLIRGEGGVFLADLSQLGFHFRFLGGFFQVILPVRFQRVVGVALHPEAAQAVLHHIADNPVRGEELGGRRDVLLGDFDVLFQGRKDLVLLLGVVVLVQPTDDLDRVPPVLLRDILDHLLKDAALPQEVIRQQKLGVVGNALEHPRQNAVQGVALGDQQVFVEFLGLVCVFETIDLFHVQAVQIQVEGFVDDLGLEVVFLVGEDPHVGGQISVDLHEAQGNEPVEPGIGNLLHHLFIVLGLDLGNQGPALGFFCVGQDLPVDTVYSRREAIVLFDPILHRFLGHPLDQRSARPNREFFNCVFVHGILSILKKHHPAFPELLYQWQLYLLHFSPIHYKALLYLLSKSQPTTFC